MIGKKTVLGVGQIGILLTGFFAFINIKEWYTVAIMKQVDDYHFGSEGPSPYYYRTSSLYAAIVFAWGTMFLSNLIYLVWSILKQKRTATIIGFVTTLVLFLVMFLHGQIGAE